MGLRVRLLGAMEVDGVDLARLGSRKARLLVARLALGRGRPVGTDALVELLWPGADRPSRPADQISVLVSRARSVLGADRVPRLAGGYALRTDWLDVEALAALAVEARRRLDAGSVATARAAVDAALALDRGVLLAEEPDADWLSSERAAAARAAAAARLVAAEVALAAGDPWAAADAAWHALGSEPYDEAALRVLMAALAASGRPARAISAYTEAVARLRDELGVDPQRQTEQAYLALLRAEPAPGPAAAQAGPAPPVLPGRAWELAALQDAYRLSATGRAVLVRVDGEAGIGKTRLLDAWMAGLPADAVVLRAAGLDFGDALPLQPVLDALGGYLHRLDPGRAAGLFEGSAELLRAFVDGPAAKSPQAANLTVLGEPAGAGQSVLLAALDTVLTRLAAGGPVALVLDDGHWLDRTTLAWLQHVRQRLAAVPLFVVVARRPEEGTAPPADRTLALGPLDRAAAAAVVGAERAGELYARSGGHPLFLVELSHAGDGDLPDSIRAAVADRCDRAGPAAATIRAAAVLGAGIDLDLLSAVLDAPPAVLLDDLEEGVRRHLLVERGTGFAFRHQLIRDALRADTGAGRSALLHRQAARSLRARRAGVDPLRVLYHARLGGDRALAAHALTDAAELAAARNDHDEALRHFDEALRLADSPELRLRRARAALPAGRFAEAAADAGAALAAGIGAPGLEVAAIAAYLLRELRRCRRLAEDGARLADDPELAASCLALAGRAAHVTGDLAGADELFARARTVAPARATPLVELWLAPLRTHQNQPQAAMDLLADPAVVRVARHPFVLPHRHLAGAQALAMLGRVAEAMDELAAVEASAAGQRTSRFAARVDNCRAWILRNVGEPDRADELNARAYDRSVAAPGMGEPVADALLGLADGRLRAGDLTAAGEFLVRARTETATPHPFAWRHELRTRLLEGRLAQARGRRDAAVEAAGEVSAEADRLGLSRYRVLARLLAAEARGAPAAEAQADVDALEEVAPLEAWWLTAALAAALDAPSWNALAVRRADRLAAGAGAYGLALRRASADPSVQHEHR